MRAEACSRHGKAAGGSGIAARGPRGHFYSKTERREIRRKKSPEEKGVEIEAGEWKQGPGRSINDIAPELISRVHVPASRWRARDFGGGLWGYQR